jgi:hypothetical protein
MASTNIRARGKIRHEEWPKIRDRFQRGETLAALARAYGCTSPAIRYILGRVVDAGTNPAVFRAAMLAASREQDTERSSSRVARLTPSRRDSVTTSSAGNDIWSRVNTDIATFLAAMDALFASESDKNYENLLSATDRLLWASARTRLELERVLAGRRANGQRRRVTA